MAEPLEPVLERLLREGAITPVVKARVDQIVRAYVDARTTQRQADTGSDMMKIMRFAASDTFSDRTGDVFAALDAMLTLAAGKIESVCDEIGLSGASAAACADLKGAVRSLDVRGPPFPPPAPHPRSDGRPVDAGLRHGDLIVTIRYQPKPARHH